MGTAAIFRLGNPSISFGSVAVFTPSRLAASRYETRSAWSAPQNGFGESAADSDRQGQVEVSATGCRLFLFFFLALFLLLLLSFDKIEELVPVDCAEFIRPAKDDDYANAIMRS